MKNKQKNIAKLRKNCYVFLEKNNFFAQIDDKI